MLIDISEAYIGLSQGVINGYELPLAAVLFTKLYEVSKYVALVNEVYNALPLIANKSKFEALDNANQIAIRDAAYEVLPSGATSSPSHTSPQRPRYNSMASR